MRCRWTPALLILPPILALLVGARGVTGQHPSPSGRLPRFDVQGHRGARGLVPENTLPAFERAMQLRVDTLELDLHFTRDGQVVVIQMGVDGIITDVPDVLITLLRREFPGLRPPTP